MSPKEAIWDALKARKRIHTLERELQGLRARHFWAGYIAGVVSAWLLTFAVLAVRELVQ